MFWIDVLGPFAMTAEGGAVAFEARTAAAVVAIVALAKGRAVPRDAVAAALWPDHDEAGARTNLRKALHRVRKAVPGVDLLLVEGDGLRLDASLVQSDLDRADRLHRTYLLAARQSEGMEALADEWQMRRRPLLEGWEADWIEPHRIQATMEANDLATELAIAHEAMGDPESALAVWHELLARVPHHAQGLQNALRLELQLRGRERAAEMARAARLLFHEDLGIEMPLELRRTIRDFRSGGLEPVPPPNHLRKRSELYLLARMFEANLADNGAEALALLARECTVAKALAHPKAMLSLLTLALEKTQGTSPERIQVAAVAATTASWASEYDLGHRWSDFVLEATLPEEFIYGRVLSMKGFMLFEQRDYRGAERALERAIEVLESQGMLDDASRAGIARAGVHWHQEEFEPAIALYEAATARSGDRTDEIATLMRGSASSNLCFVFTTLGRWAEAIPHGRTSLSYANEHAVFGFIVSGPLGLALFANGQRTEGLRLLGRALSSTLREGMPRFNQLSIDFAAIALALAGRTRVAQCILHANGIHRAALRHARSPAERRLIVSAASLDPDALPERGNPLAGQSAATLSEWACEELDRLEKKEEDDREEAMGAAF